MLTFELVVYVCAPIIILLLEKPFGLITRLTDYFNSIWVFKQEFTLYKLISYFLLIGVWAYFGLFLPNVLALHENLITVYYVNGHYLSWLILMAAITRYGYFNVIKGAYVGALVYSIHELVWLISDGIYLGQVVALLEHFWPLVAVLSFLGAGYFLAYRSLPSWKEVAIIASIIAFDVVWYVGGWQIGVQNFYAVSPKTLLFNDPATNLIEVASWALPAIIVMLPTPKTFGSLGLNSIILGVIELGLQLGALGNIAYASSSLIEVGAPAAALIGVYTIIQIWPVYKARHEEILNPSGAPI